MRLAAAAIGKPRWSRLPAASQRAKDQHGRMRGHVSRYLQSTGRYSGILEGWANSTALDCRAARELPLDEAQMFGPNSLGDWEARYPPRLEATTAAWSHRYHRP